MARAPKTCIEGCGRTRSVGARCAECARRHDRARGSRHERGYDARHDSIRARLMRDLVRRVRRGEVVPCRRCGAAMWPTQDLHAAHSVDLRVDPTARADHLEHAECNLAWRAD